jgi:uncharacterized protein YjbI with pentapeptide repeats
MFALNKRTRWIGTYNDLKDPTKQGAKVEPKKDTQAIVQDKTLSQRKKLGALVDLCRDKNAPKPKAKEVRNLDMTGVNAKGLKLKNLGPNVLRVINWIGADFTKQDFRKMPLHGMNLEATKLYRADFKGSGLQNANFKNAKMGQTSMKNADARGATMEHLQTRHDVKMTNTAMQGVALGAADIRRGNKVEMTATRRHGTAIRPDHYNVLKACKAADDYGVAPPKLTARRKHQFEQLNVA